MLASRFGGLTEKENQINSSRLQQNVTENMELANKISNTLAVCFTTRVIKELSAFKSNDFSVVYFLAYNVQKKHYNVKSSKASRAFNAKDALCNSKKTNYRMRRNYFISRFYTV